MGLANLEGEGVIAVSGYGWSGSGLYEDFLSGTELIESLEVEFSLIKEPKGLLDLDYSLFENWDVIRAHYAIEDFLEFVSILNRKNEKFGKWGLDLGTLLGVDLEERSREFVARIAEFEYRGRTRVQHYSAGSLTSFCRKLRARLPFVSQASQSMYLAKPTRKEFQGAVQSYIEGLLIGFESEFVLLDQAIPTSNPHRGLCYLPNAKLIVVDRDPRDIYVDLIRNNALIGAELPGLRRARKFVKWHSKLRESVAAPSGQIEYFKFEDLVLRFDSTVVRLAEFLGLSEEALRNSSYDLGRSALNIGLWKHFEFQDELECIQDSIMSGK